VREFSGLFASEEVTHLALDPKPVWSHSMIDRETPTLITRRRGLQLLGSAGAGLLLLGPGARAATRDGDDHVADATRACMLTAEQEEGPFYVAYDHVRSDIVAGETGLPMILAITIINSRTCKPLRHAAVDIWQCNASGVYSDESSEDTLGVTYLRGVQFTDAHGKVEFRTIFPGHYSGRTNHIHAKVHTDGTDAGGRLSGGHVAHTGQMFPSEAVYTEVYALSPYDAETAEVLTHAEDRVWTEQHGSEALMRIRHAGNRLTAGLVATITLAVDPSARPAAV
jgi:protocatechuate 3,4-dioxygenase beta subunit